MSGLPRGYDEWRTRSDTDEADAREAKRLRDEARAERADDDRDRQRDEEAMDDRENR